MKEYRLLPYSRDAALFGSELLLTARFPVALLTLLYVATVAAGYISLLTAGAMDQPPVEEPTHG